MLHGTSKMNKGIKILLCFNHIPWVTSPLLYQWVNMDWVLLGARYSSTSRVVPRLSPSTLGTWNCYFTHYSLEIFTFQKFDNLPWELELKLVRIWSPMTLSNMKYSPWDRKKSHLLSIIYISPFVIWSFLKSSKYISCHFLTYSLIIEYLNFLKDPLFSYFY